MKKRVPLLLQNKSVLFKEPVEDKKQSTSPLKHSPRKEDQIIIDEEMSAQPGIVDERKQTKQPYDKLTNAMKSMIIKEVDKVKATCRDNCFHLNETIKESEAIYSEKYNDLKSKINSNIIRPADVEAIAEAIVNRRLEEYKFNDNK